MDIDVQIITVTSAVVSALVAFVGIQQYFLARERFKLDLFEKRFSVFKAAEKFLNDAIRDHHVSHANLVEFDKGTQITSYIFGKDIVGFLADIRTKANQSTSYYESQRPLEGGSPERMDLGQKNHKLLEEFITTQAGLKDKFSKYLEFKKWKFGFLTGIFN